MAAAAGHVFEARASGSKTPFSGITDQETFIKRKSSILGDAKTKRMAAAVTVAICMSMGGIAIAADSTAAVKGPDFDTLKKMEGEWQVNATNRIIGCHTTSDDSAVLETVYVGGPNEMVDVYTLDKGRLVMTHYCDRGNLALQAYPDARSSLFRDVSAPGRSGRGGGLA